MLAWNPAKRIIVIAFFTKCVLSILGVEVLEKLTKTTTGTAEYINS